MNYLKNAWSLFDNYFLARLQRRPSTAQFWYLPEPPTIHTDNDLRHYKQAKTSPLYLIDYREKLPYKLENSKGIIVLYYNKLIGRQINPEAAFQYALGLHDQFQLSQDQSYLEKFWHYANYFQSEQTADGLWEYSFDWYGSKAPWYSALAQSRGASVMLRAWLHSGKDHYLQAAKNAIQKFTIPTSQGGFLHEFEPEKCTYFEEYPNTPTGVINGFMAALMSIWELKYWIGEKWLDDLWQGGIQSLEKMLPYYTTNWWSLYDLDKQTPIANVNSPRYHLLEIHYLKILSILSNSLLIEEEYIKRMKQYEHPMSKLRAFFLKSIRKILYK
jgi:hypothetical protein